MSQSVSQLETNGLKILFVFRLTLVFLMRKIDLFRQILLPHSAKLTTYLQVIHFNNESVCVQCFLLIDFFFVLVFCFSLVCYIHNFSFATVLFDHNTIFFSRRDYSIARMFFMTIITSGRIVCDG